MKNGENGIVGINHGGDGVVGINPFLFNSTGWIWDLREKNGFWGI